MEEQIEWLQRKAAQGGFAVLSAMPTQQQRTDDRRHELKFFSVQFDGVLQVAEPERFRQTLAQGIGSGKAFGFGLLSVAPAR
jgi:CRISPR system Cascade subunit CasE